MGGGTTASTVRRKGGCVTYICMTEVRVIGLLSYHLCSIGVAEQFTKGQQPNNSEKQKYLPWGNMDLPISRQGFTLR